MVSARRATTLALFGFGGAALCGAFGCRRSDERKPSRATASAPGSVARERAAPSASAGSSDPAPRAKPAARDTVRELVSDAGLTGITVGELSDVGPAGPSVAVPDGILLVTKDDRLLAARARNRAAARPELSTVNETPAAFAPLAVPPSVALNHAYWISRGRLVRRHVGGEGELEVLRTDARPASRTSAAELAGRAVVAYIGRPDSEGTAHAWLWSDGRTFDLTPDGSGASSVALTRHGDALLAVAIDGRSGMTPLHARTVRAVGTELDLGPDVVAWVGGSAQSYTQVSVGSSAGHAFAFLPIGRDAVHFGLATIELGSTPRMDAVASFYDYPNGIDLAPVATAELCGRGHVAFVRPATSARHSSQELVLSPTGTNQALVLASARGFASLTLAARPSGGLVSYVADGRTWGLGLGCS